MTNEIKLRSPMQVYTEKNLKTAILLLEKYEDEYLKFSDHSLDPYSFNRVCDFTTKFLKRNHNTFIENRPMIVGIGATKGGVGKSTVAENLAQGFARAGLKTGIIDTDLADPNDAIYVYQDIEDLKLDQNENVVFGEKGNIIDILFGRKVDGKRSLQRKSLEEIGRQSKSKPHLTYFLSEQLGDSYGERGNSAKVLQTAQNILLKEARKLRNYDVVILDFPAGTPEHLSAYIGCDERGYVVDFGNRASFSGIQNIARLVANKKIDGNNFLVINRIPQFAKRQDLQDAFAMISSTLEGFVRNLGDDCYMKEARKIVSATNQILKQSSLEKLAFDARPAFLRRLKDIEKSTDDGMPYLAGLTKTGERNFGYSAEIFNLAMNMFDSYLRKIQSNNSGERKK